MRMVSDVWSGRCICFLFIFLFTEIHNNNNGHIKQNKREPTFMGLLHYTLIHYTLYTLHYTLYTYTLIHLYTIHLYTLILIHLLARSPEDPQRIRVASVFELFCVLCSLFVVKFSNSSPHPPLL